jgi:hypothetical protein
MPPPARSDFQQLLEALRAAGYSIHEAEEQEAEEQQPAFLDISSPGAGPDAHLLVYLWRLYAIGVLGRGGFAPVARRRFNVQFRQPETGFRHTLAHAVPGKTESLYLGYEPTRNVYAAWQGRGPGARAWRPETRSELLIPERTLDAAERRGIAFNVRQKPAGEVVAAFRPDSISEFLDIRRALEDLAGILAEPVEALPPAAEGVDLVVPADVDPADLVGAMAVAPAPEVFETRRPRRIARRPRKLTASVRPSRKDVATGFAAADDPSSPLDRMEPLALDSSYWFWFEIGEVVGSIEERPVAIPDAVPDRSRLIVQLFGFPEELRLEADASRGEMELASDGGARVATRAATASQDEELHRRRLFFPVQTPRRRGDFRLRCNVYHGSTLVQSRLIRVRVGGGARRGRAALRSVLDYSLADKVTPRVAARLPAHSLSIQVNGEGSTHQFRFFRQSEADLFCANSTLGAGDLEDHITNSRAALRRAAWGSAEPWRDGKDEYRYSEDGSDEQFTHDVLSLAMEGYRMYDGIVDILSDKQTGILEAATREPGVIQIVASRSNLYLPAGLIYDHPLYDGKGTKGLKLCSEFSDALADPSPLEDSRCMRGDCPSYGDLEVVCPSGFWGYRHEIGWPPSTDDPAHEVMYSNRPHLTIGVSTDLDFYDTHAQTIRALGDGDIVDSAEKLFRLMRAGGAHLLYLYCHGGVTKTNAPFFEVGPRESDTITRAALRSLRIRWDAPRPLVFINGCHTTALEPQQALELVSGFVGTANALGVIGTEITVVESLACAFAEQMLPSFMDGTQTVGAATRSARLALLKHRNPLGLVYVPFVAAPARLIQAASAKPVLSSDEEAVKGGPAP